MSMCGVVSCCRKRGLAMTSVFSWQNSVCLCPTSFCTPRPNLPVTPGVSWLPTFAFQSPMMKGTSFFGVSSTRSCMSSQNRSASSALTVAAQIWFTLLLNGLPWKRTELILLFLRLHPSTAFRTLFNLTFQVPMQYCSLQHQTILPSPVTSTTGHCFCFGSLSSFLLELFLHSSSAAYWASTNLGSSSFSVLFFAFSYCSWASQGKNTEVVCHSLFQWEVYTVTHPS